MALVVVAACIVATIASKAASQELWAETRHGMSLDEVRAVVPNADPPVEPTTLGTGAREQLRLPGLDIANRKFDASFYFADARLVQVTLNIAEDQRQNFSNTMLVFDALIETLRSEYGPERSREVAWGTRGEAVAVWMNGRTRISVLAIGVADNSTMLSIIYNARIATDTDEL